MIGEGTELIEVSTLIRDEEGKFSHQKKDSIDWQFSISWCLG